MSDLERMAWAKYHHDRIALLYGMGIHRQIDGIRKKFFRMYFGKPTKTEDARFEVGKRMGLVQKVSDLQDIILGYAEGN